MISRTLVSTICGNLRPGFINVIYGPRRVGKTVLLKQISEELKNPGIWFDGDQQEVRDAFSKTSLSVLSKLVENSDVVYIDEAQRIPNVGLSLKILIDAYPDKKFFVTGSSSLSLSRGLQEQLTGRSKKYRLFPLSTVELTESLPDYQKKSLLESQLIYGGYPYLQSLSAPNDKQNYLKSLIDDYLFKDVFDLKDIAQPENLKKLTTLLAYQIGSEVSYNELAGNLGVDVKTVRRYISLLKQSFVIYELGSFSKNLRKEVAKSKKYYFWDLGLRNALIDQFHPLNLRTDTGTLWENFLVIERVKKHEYENDLRQYYFWRTYERAEIDWIESEGEKLSAYEFKWRKGKTRTPKAFLDTYETKVSLVNRENYLEFVG